MDEYLPPVVTKLKADLSDFIAGITQARALMKAFATDIKNDMLEASRSAGGLSGMVMVTEMRTVVKEQLKGFGDDVEESIDRDIVPKFDQAGVKAAKGMAGSLSGLLMPMLVFAIVAAAPAIAAAIAGAIQLGFGLGFIGLGAFMLRDEPLLIAAATRFRDRVSAVFKTASAPMLGPFITALDVLGKAFEKLGPQINTSFASLATAIVPLAEGFAGMMEGMSPGLTAMLIAAGPMLIEFGKQLPGIGVAFGEFFQMVADNGPAISAFINDMGRILPAIIRGVTIVLGILMGVYKWISDIHNIMKDAGWETPFDGVVTSGKALWAWLSETGPKVGQWFSDRGTDIADFASDASDRVGQFVDDVGAWFAAIPGKIGDALAAIPGLMATIAINTFDAFFFWTAFGITKIVTLVKELPTNLGIILANMWIEVRRLFSEGVDTTVAVAETLPGKVGAFFARLWMDAKAFVGNLRMDIVHITGQAIIGVESWFASLPGKVATHLISMKARAVAFFWDASSWLYSAGKNLIEGLTRGVMAAVDAAVDAIRRAMDRIKSGARQALGISSPSKVFAEMGMYTMQGYMQGIEGQRGNLARLMGVFAAPVAGSAMGAGLAAAGAYGGGARGGDGAAASDRPILVQLVLDGGVLVEKLIAPAQQRKLRTGSTGLD